MRKLMLVMVVIVWNAVQPDFHFASRMDRKRTKNGCNFFLSFRTGAF